MIPTQYRAFQVPRFGGPEVLELKTLPVPKPAAGEALVRIHAAGVNFVDNYQRSGHYPGQLPFIPGNEGAGEIVAVGPDVPESRIGQRVAWAQVRGSYAEYAVVPSARLVPVPDNLDHVRAAAVMLQGMTAHYLSHSTYPIPEGRLGSLFTRLRAELGFCSCRCGQDARREHHHWNRLQRRESDARTRGGRDGCDSLHSAGFRGGNEAHHRRKRRARRL